jgi:DNA-directed RNA polymerase subunit RPC12/RpoP
MVQCPQCQTAVGVRDHAGGSRVDCPHCGTSFIVPGYTGGVGYAPEPAAGGFSPPAADNDDDDWLNLSPPTPLPPNRSFAPNDLASGLSIPNEPPTDSPSPSKVPDDSVWDEDPSETPDDITDTFDERPAGTDSDGNKIQYQTEYRVRCLHCGTQNDVKASQAGKQIRCRDCFTLLRVPNPPRVQRKPQIDMEAAPAFQFTPAASSNVDRPADPFRKSASEYLEAASRIEESEVKPDLDTPSIREWLIAVFGIFAQIGVMVHWLILSTIASAVTFFALVIDSPILVVGLFAAGGFFTAIVLACGFVIMQSVANEEETVDDWPITLEPMAWLAPSTFCFAAAGLAYGPGFLLGYMTFGNSLTTVCLSMMSTFVIFPFVLLSMLDMQNIFVPFSPDVGRSITRCEEAWGGFYFSSGLLFFVVFLIFAFASVLAPPAMAVVAIFTAVFATFIYFAMLGRLAVSIGHSVNAEARPNDIDKERQSERKNK